MKKSASELNIQQQRQKPAASLLLSFAGAKTHPPQQSPPPENLKAGITSAAAGPSHGSPHVPHAHMETALPVSHGGGVQEFIASRPMTVRTRMPVDEPVASVATASSDSPLSNSDNVAPHQGPLQRGQDQAAAVGTSTHKAVTGSSSSRSIMSGPAWTENALLPHRTPPIASSGSSPRSHSYGLEPRQPNSFSPSQHQPILSGAARPASIASALAIKEWAAAATHSASASSDDCEEETKRIVGAAYAQSRSSSMQRISNGHERKPSLSASRTGLFADLEPRTLTTLTSREATMDSLASTSAAAGTSSLTPAELEILERRRSNSRSNYHLTSGQAAVELFLRLNHARQTLDFVKRQASVFGTLDRAKMDVWQALDMLNELREYEAALMSASGSEVDPEMPLRAHALQTAELCR